MKPWRAGLGTSITSASIWAPDRPSCNASPAQWKEKPVFIIDEDFLLRLQVLAELHTITQLQGDFKLILPIILAGHNNLADFLIYRVSLPLASRVVARSYLAGVSLQDMQVCLLRTSKSQASSRTSYLIRPSPPYSRALAASSEGPTTWLEARDHSCRRGADSNRLLRARSHRHNRIDLIK
ncbi:hypothetical protein DFAR_800019 [Desulfarculales bacterium]